MTVTSRLRPDIGLAIDPQRRISSWSDSLGLINPFTQATNANKPLLSGAGNEENLAQYSEQLDNAIWTNVNAPVTPNAANNPVNGAATADLIVADTTSAAHELRQNIAVVSGKEYIIECYAKRNSGTTQFRLVGTTLFTNVNFAINDSGTVESTGAGASNVSVIPLGDNWFRLSMTGVATSNGNASLRLALLNSSGTGSYVGDNTGWFVFRPNIRAADTEELDSPTTDHPLYAGINGRQVLTFNGAQWLDSISTLASLYTASEKLTYIVLVPFTSTSITQRLLTDATGGARYYPHSIQSNNYQIENFSGSYQTRTQPQVGSEIAIFRSRHNGGQLYAAKDVGAGYNESAGIASGNTGALTGRLRIGAQEGGTNGFYGQIAEIVTGNVGTPDTTIENELRYEWLNSTSSSFNPITGSIEIRNRNRVLATL